MTQVQRYNEQKAKTNNVIANLERALGRDSDRNDKHTLRLNYSGKHSDSWSDAYCMLHASYGYYGSSSGSSAMNKAVAEYLVKAINAALPSLADKAMEYAKADLEKARLAAQAEAKEILGDVTAAA